MFVYDNIHGNIDICKRAVKIIDTPEFQRLRNIKQLGCIYHVFTGASHNRFEHSIGVYYLARKYMDIINKKYQDKGTNWSCNFDEKEYFLISIAALIHDLGHGPFSHLFDDYIKISVHEERSVEIFRYMNSKYNLEYSERDIQFISDCIDPKNIDYGKYISLGYPVKKYCFQIVSNSNGIDVDRFDYILRDCKMTGLSYGIEYERIMDNTYIKDLELIYDRKCQVAIDSFFNTRYILYKEICNHHTVVSIEHHIKEILSEIDGIFEITKSVKNKDWEKYILLTDDILSSIDFRKSPRLTKAKEILNDIRTRNIYKLVYEIVSDEEVEIVAPNKNIVVIKTKIKYYSDELPKYLPDKKFMNFVEAGGGDEYITKLMCKVKHEEEDAVYFEQIKFK